MHVEKVTFFPPSPDASIECAEPAALPHTVPVPGEGRQVDVPASQKLQQLIVGVDANQGRDESTSRCSGNDAWKKPTQVQCLDDTQMTQSEYSAALQD
jgi:hypothetical protein